MKKLFYDVETTGLYHWQHVIHQLSGCIEIDGEVTDFFDFKIAPDPRAKIDQAALDIAGKTVEQIMAYPPSAQVHAEFLRLLAKHVDKYNKKDKFFLIGYNNAGFDDNFLSAWFKQNKDDYLFSWFWSSKIDVMVLAGQKLMHQRHEMENFKLSTVAKALGIVVDESKLHDAEYDILLTREIYNIVTG